MAHLINKDALVAEIEKRIKRYDTPTDGMGGNYSHQHECQDILSFINTLEVKEVDLEKEIDKFYGMYRDKNGVTHDMKDNEICFDWKEDGNYLFIIEFAKHFFELGLKAKQG